MKTTSVPGARARQAKSSSSASWPATTVTCEETPRCVIGIPAEAGTAASDETPGTTSNGMPAAASASASSPPRPKTNGIAALEADDVEAAPAQPDEQLVDLLLARAGRARSAPRPAGASATSSGLTSRS